MIDISSIRLCLGDAQSHYDLWDAPTLIISDGPYGLNGYDGDLKRPDQLPAWYEPHVAAWTRRATASTTLWFWNTEVGWAEVHSILRKAGWVYRACCIWDKGLAHVAGNTNTRTLRKFPVVTEVCVHYVREPQFRLATDGPAVSAQDWLREEWRRTGLTFAKANEACGVKNAATRKYLTGDHLWYFPPRDVFQRLVQFANANGAPDGRPYFSVDGNTSLPASQWEQLRGKFYCEAGITNVWQVPAVRGKERIKVQGNAVHPNQKPLALMQRLVRSCSDLGDTVWEPFGGLCTASVAAAELGRKAFAAEINPAIWTQALARIKQAAL
jgi:site-specific DNA-methyltransferase (adenine-specific)